MIKIRKTLPPDHPLAQPGIIFGTRHPETWKVPSQPEESGEEHETRRVASSSRDKTAHDDLKGKG